MKTIWILLFAFLWAGCNSGSEQTETDMEMPAEQEISQDNSDSEEEVLSPPREAEGEIGGTNILVDYSAPSVRSRVIWDELVSFGEIWVSGAHMATSVEFEDDVLVNEEPVPAGKYAFFTIPGEDSWTVILNEHWDQHQAGEYDEAQDVARFDVQPQPNDHTEQLAYSVVSETDDSGFIELAWEEVKIQVPVSSQ
ncbi:MAG: DUF2911 domain-containing protein [Balneolaceae bacterium]